MKYLSLDKMKESLDIKEESLNSLNSPSDILTVILLMKNGVELNGSLSEQVSKEMDYNLPVIEGVVSEADKEGRAYDAEFAKLIAFLIAKNEEDPRAKEVAEKYEEFKLVFDALFEDYQEEVSEMMNDAIERTKKITELAKIYGVETDGKEDTSLYKESPSWKDNLKDVSVRYYVKNGVMYLKNAHSNKKGAFYKYWKSEIIPMCKRNNILYITLEDSTSETNDIWGRYGFSGTVRSGGRRFYTISADYPQHLRRKINTLLKQIEIAIDNGFDDFWKEEIDERSEKFGINESLKNELINKLENYNVNRSFSVNVNNYN